MKEGDRVRILKDEEAEWANPLESQEGQLGTVYLVDRGDYYTYLDIDLDNGDTMVGVNSVDVEEI